MMMIMITVVCILFTPEKQDLNSVDDRCHAIYMAAEKKKKKNPFFRS